LPTTVNLLWGLVVFVGLPRMFSSIRTLTWAVPDIGYLLLASGAIALVWSAARWLLIRRFARASRDGARPADRRISTR